MLQRCIIVLFLTVHLIGCESLSTWSLLTAKNYKIGREGFSAELPADWMRYNSGQFFMMTKDGLSLELIAVERIKSDKKLEYTKKKFDLSMSPQDLAEVEIDNFNANEKINQFEVQSNQPMVIDGRSASRLEYYYTTLDGLRMHGVSMNFIHKKWVYRIRYEAAAQHYFSTTSTDFEHFIETFKVL